MIKGGVCFVHDRQQWLLAKVSRGRSHLYIADLKVAQPVCLSTRCGEDPWMGHACYDHLNFDALRKMGLVNMVRGLPVLDHLDQLCDSYLAGKHRHTPSSRVAKFRANKFLNVTFTMIGCLMWQLPL